VAFLCVQKVRCREKSRKLIALVGYENKIREHIPATQLNAVWGASVSRSTST